MVIDVSGDFRQLSDCWFPTELNAAMRVMTPQERVDMVSWANAYVLDEAKKTQAGMNVTKTLRLFVPNHPDWTGTPLLPLYDKLGRDEVRAARLYGSLVCRVAVNRAECFWCFAAPVAEDRHSRTYVLSGHVPVPR